MTTSIARPPQPLGFRFQQRDLTNGQFSLEPIKLDSSLGFVRRPRPPNSQSLKYQNADYRSSRPTQYAHPLPLSSSRPTGSATLTGRQAEEHMLRRKTPNGTLVAGYDGDQVEWIKRPHAFKHLVMQVEGRQMMKNPLRLNRAFGSLEATFPNQPLRQDTDTRDGRGSWDQYTTMTLDSSFQKPTTRLDAEPASLDHPVRAFPRMDSILNQSQGIQRPLLNGQVQPVSAALQSGWQPSTGPTTSDKYGRFSSCWPEGSYVPYRPAALRDVRTNPSDMTAWNISPVDACERVFPPAGRNDQVLQHYNHLDSPSAFESTYSKQSTSNIEENRHVAQNCSPIDLQGLSLGTSKGGNEGWLAKRSAFRTILPQEQSTCSVARDAGWQNLSNSASSLRADRLPHGVASSHLRFKERMLIEAHRAYLNLLASQHQACHHIGTRQTTNERPPNPMTTKPPSHNSLHSVHVGQPSPGSSATHCFVEEGRRLAVSNLQHTGMTHIASATKALEVLTQLCQESEWQWVDGILLGGCLAYALSNYEKALQWYYRVLACDP